MPTPAPVVNMMMPYLQGMQPGMDRPTGGGMLGGADMSQMLNSMQITPQQMLMLARMQQAEQEEPEDMEETPAQMYRNQMLQFMQGMGDLPQPEPFAIEDMMRR